MLSELTFNLGNEILSLLVNLVLGVEEGTALLVAQSLDDLDLFLPIQLGFKCQSGCSGAPSLPDLAIKLLDFALQTNFEII